MNISKTILPQRQLFPVERGVYFSLKHCSLIIIAHPHMALRNSSTGTGLAAYQNNTLLSQQAFSLGSSPIIFQAEIQAQYA